MRVYTSRIPTGLMCKSSISGDLAEAILVEGRSPPAALRASRIGGKVEQTPKGRSPMEIVPVGPGFAAELRGVTLAEIAADDAAYKVARAALEQHSVIVFRGEEVTDEAQLALSRRFGPIEESKVRSLGAGVSIVIVA